MSSYKLINADWETNSLTWATLLIVMGFSTWVAVIDWRQFRIPNVMTFPFAVAGFAHNAYWFGWSGVGEAFTGLAIGFFLLLLPYLMGGFGGGDVKLLAAIGAWVGARAVFEIFLISAVLLGGVSALIILCHPDVRKRAWLNLRMAMANVKAATKSTDGQDHVDDVVKQENRHVRAVPYGVALVGGIFLLAGFRWYTSFGP